MAEYDNTNRGVLFKNRDKDEEHPNWPDYAGEIDVEGYKFWLSAWLKTSKKGVKYFSVAVKPKQAKAAASKPEMADEIPF